MLDNATTSDRRTRKNLVWPDNLDDPEQAYVHLNDIIDDIGDAHTVILEDSNGMVRLYLRHVRSDQVSANILLEFKLTAPEGFPERIPQVSSSMLVETIAV
ncbi:MULTISPECIES: hypothetical protein [Xenorhabdus]|uniref:hypothetical protein n=1 Tax=Xenorhabdus TaxID=626 RepID=UPI000A5AEA07|nr:MULTISPECIES: hypothetical protein [Xenorhabdus]